MDPAKEKEVAEEYLSSLTDLNVNSKPLISMLTMLAEENMAYATAIVNAIEEHLEKVSTEIKLTILYLIDSIVKNVGNQYRTLFSHNIVNMFCRVFEKANERIREKLFNLRQTWKDVFPNTKLYALDVKVNAMDNNWPITAVVVSANPPSTIHVNPNFFKPGAVLANEEIQKQLKDKERELLELQKKKLELELQATKKKLEEQEKEMKEKVAEKMNMNSQKVIPPIIGSQINTPNMLPLIQPTSVPNKVRIAPVSNPALLARPRDPRLARQMQLQQDQTQQQPKLVQQVVPSMPHRPMIPPHPMYQQTSMSNGSIRPPYNIYPNQNPLSRTLPKIPKFSKQHPASTVISQTNESVNVDPRRGSKEHDRERERERNTRDKERELKSKSREEKSKQSSSSRDKIRESSKSSRSGEKERKKSSDETKSPKKKRSDETSPKKSSSKSPSTKSSSKKASPKSPEIKSKNSNESVSATSSTTTKVLAETKKDVDLRVLPHLVTPIPKSSPTDGGKKLTKQENDQLLMRLLQEDANESNSTMTVPTKTSPESTSVKASSPVPVSSISSPSTSHETNDFIPESKNESSNKDIDLRKLMPAARESSPVEKPTISSKKRSISNEVSDSEPSTKRNKSELLDTLFGSQDVDLRTQLPVTVTPPPPPLISNEKDAATKQIPEAKKSTEKPKKTFEEVRAKLAEAAKKKKDSSPKESEKKRKLSDSLNKKISSLDTDWRDNIKFDLEVDDNLYKDAFNDKMKTIFQQAKDQLDKGQIDADQYKDTMAQLIKMNEKQKIMDVKRQERKNIDSGKRTEDSDSENSSSNSNLSMAKKQKQIHENLPGKSGGKANNLSDAMSITKKRESKWGPKEMPQMPPQMPQIPPPMPPMLAPILAQQPGFITPWEQNPFLAQQMQLLQQQKQVLAQNIVQPGLPHEIPLNNSMRTVRLDGTCDYLLRYYGETAIIFNENGQAKEIKFNPGYSVVIIDDKYQVGLTYNDPYKQITIDGKVHQIKFGAPTREIYIDNCYYECYFNNRPTQIVLDGKIRTIKIDGPPPEVKIFEARNDLVLGRIHIVIDADSVIPVFLDTTVQLFELDGNRHTLQFADFFLSFIINGTDFYKIEFGGLPKNYTIGGKKHFIRLTALPDSIEAGKVNLPGMIRTRLFRDLVTPPPSEIHLPIMEIAAPVLGPPFAPFVGPIQPTNSIPGLVVEQQPIPIPQTQPIVEVPVPTIPQLNLNVDELFQKLVATGIIGNKLSKPSDNASTSTSPASTDAARKAKEMEKKKVTPVTFSRPETIKTRQQAIVELLYSGMQCSSCGLRFPPEQTMKYSQHLDWHFRQNRRDRDSQRRAHSRKWYYDCADWIRYEEIEDLDEREKNFFETQQNELDQAGDDSNPMRSVGASGENASVPSCAAGPDDLNRHCDMCHEQFDQFYNEETEEWHLRLAMKVDDKFYHPTCYEDFKASLTLDESGLSSTIKEGENEDSDDIEMKEVKVKSEKTEEEIKAEETQKTETGNSEDDDDVIVLPDETPTVTEILDDDDLPKEETEKTEETENLNLANATDDDVVIEEPIVEVQNLVDDDDEDMADSNDVIQTAAQNEKVEPLVIKIKEEPKDDGYDEENEEDNFVDVSTIQNEIIGDDTFSNSPKPSGTLLGPSAAELHEINDNAVMISPSTIDDDNSHLSRSDELELQYQRQQSELFDVEEGGSHPPNGGIDHHHLGGTATTQAAGTTGQSKIKIVLSSMVANSLNSNRNLSNVNSCNENSNLESVNNNKSDSAVNSSNLEHNNDSSSVQHVQMDTSYVEPDIEFEVKPNLKGIKFDKNLVPIKRGLENSGLCSIM